MEENNMNVAIIDNLIKLNKLEINKIKLVSAIFLRKCNEIVEKKVQSLEAHFEGQAKYYDQNLEYYTDIYQPIIEKYTNQLNQIIEKYNDLFVNMILELQEAECNQKIAITNLKKSFDIKEELLKREPNDLLDEYKKKVEACAQKKINYDVIIEECEKELNNCAYEMEKKINSLFSDKSSQISLKEEGALKKFINKIVNKFTGASKFNTYVIEPINVELEMMDGKLPDITNNIKNDTINFVAKIKQAKDETNAIFETMLNG